MAQGTIKVTNGSVDVVGTGTAFTTMKPGSFLTFVLVGVAYTVAIDSVQSATALKLAVKFDGPTTSGVAFDESPVGSMALATMGVTVQAQKALRMMIADATNWREVFSNKQTITVTLPDGSQYSGYSWGYISDQLKNIDLDELHQIRDDTVAAKNQAQGFATAASGSATSAQTARTGAETARTGAETARTQAQTAQQGAAASATTAGNGATTATTQAGIATTQAGLAKNYADSINPASLLSKSQNLNDVADKAAARNNLDVFNRAEVGDYLGGFGITSTGVIANNDANAIAHNGFFAGPGAAAGAANYYNAYAPGMVMRRVNAVAQIQADVNALAWRYTQDRTSSAFTEWKKLVSVNDYGVGATGVTPPSDTSCQFISTGSADAWTPGGGGGGTQTTYANIRVFQTWTATSGAFFSRYVSSGNAQESRTTAPWTQFQAAGTSDANLKKIMGGLNVEASLDNINRMEFKLFKYLDDTPERSARRGIIAQQVMTIDKEYVHDADIAGKMTLDLNPLVTDALAAIKALRARDVDNKERIERLEQVISELTSK